MKRISLFLILVTASVQQSFAQDSAKRVSSELLQAYFQLKDNLVKSNATSAAASAGDLVRAINATDQLIINHNSRATLLKEAEAISLTTDIRIQREKFATLSNHMIELAKAVKLSPAPVYQQYCPMKKASWLSNEPGIKNPYYGSAMLTCGNVKDTL